MATFRPMTVELTVHATRGYDTISIRPNHRIRFRHPGYRDYNVLLDLAAADHPEGGLDYNTALVACGIVTGNTWGGWFTETVDGVRVEPEGHKILRKQDYFFHSPNAVDGTPYPVIPTFSEWAFPHNNMPACWNDIGLSDTTTKVYSASSLSTAINTRDRSCRMSLSTEALEVAHICPHQESSWWISNEMSNYLMNPSLAGSSSIDDVVNVILLRSDLHKGFDNKKFVFLPKELLYEDGTYTSALVTHLMLPSPELAILYHNVPLHPVNGLSGACLLARFAWTLFPLIRNFLLRNMPRTLTGRVLSPDGATTFSASQIKDLLDKQSPTKSRSQSPKKRSRDEDGRADERGENGTEDATPVPPVNHKRRKAVHPTIGSPRAATCIGSSDHGQYSPPSAFPRSKPLSSNIDLSNRVAETLHASQLREQWLKKERERSDPDGTWEAELEWLREAGDRAMDADEIERWYIGHGTDIIT
ncbi:hypothetical protein MMC30_008241 [Trapelia coarctata]|nr:hypothetical protein [Trapelia coarctata]